MDCYFHSQVLKIAFRPLVVGPQSEEDVSLDHPAGFGCHKRPESKDADRDGIMPE